MRSSRVLSLLAGAALLAACGGDNNGPSNPAPTAAFTFTCAQLACTFTNTSTDDGTFTSSWDLGDGSAAVTTKDVAHTYSAGGTYNVTLTVTDNSNNVKAVTHQVIAGTPPTANFTSTCTNLDCQFTDQSVDSDVGGSIASYLWDFGDGSATATTQNPLHSYTAAGTFTVTLTVTDNAGNASAPVSKQVTVTAALAGAPTANFTVSCSSFDCDVTDHSTVDPSNVGGSIVGWAWNFGDSQTSNVKNPPIHTYNVTDVTTFTITLTVTDNNGLTGTTSKEIAVAPPAHLTCNGTDCTLGLDQKSTVVVTLQSHDCQAHGNKFVLTAPIVDTLFTDGCFAPVSPDPAASFTLNGGAAFNAGTHLDAEVLSGVSGVQNSGPQLRVTGSFASGWTLEFDDGFVGPGEPDFNDLIITIKATVVP
jgi:PKD repeat protein